MKAEEAILLHFRATPPDTLSLRSELKFVAKELASANRAAVLRLARYLIKAGIPRFVAYELIKYHPPTRDTLTPAEVKRLAAGITDWGDIDSFSLFIAGPAWRSGLLPDSLIRQWARSPNWSWRRTALVCTVALNAPSQGGTGDTKRTLAICHLLIADRHPMVVKALSWALRELSKRQPEIVEAFLIKHGAQLPALVKREVTKKLAAGTKTPRARASQARK